MGERGISWIFKRPRVVVAPNRQFLERFSSARFERDLGYTCVAAEGIIKSDVGDFIANVDKLKSLYNKRL